MTAWRVQLTTSFFTAFFVFTLGVIDNVLSLSEPPKEGRAIDLRSRPLPVKPATIAVSGDANIAWVVVKFKDREEIRLSNGRFFSKASRPTDGIREVLTPYLPNRLERLLRNFEVPKLDREKEIYELHSGHELADLNSYYKIEVASPSEAEALVNRLNQLDQVEIAYVEPMPEPAGDIAPTTPDYQASQDYREAAPDGIDADYANTVPGGDGSGVMIIDIEGNWRTTHEDLDKAVGGIIAGEPINDISWRNHGTAVIGELIAGDNGYGVTGICPGADIGMVSIGSLSTAEALYTAIDTLEPGDVILIELHAPGPHYNFQVRQDQLGYICMEYWQANFDAIQYAWAKGITVVEAAGNGAENFDDIALYGQLFDTNYRNSRAIIVGAGYPASSPLDRIRHGFSNYGERVNLQGYGSGVYTTGYGDLFNPGWDENQYYTAAFGGTSSASPIITGAVACLQGYFKAAYGGFLSSDYIRDILAATGTPQLGDSSFHIGPRPDLEAAITGLVGPPSLYASPIYLDTTLQEGQSITVPLWLVNRSTTDNIFYYIYDLDTLAKAAVPNWLEVGAQSGSVPPADSSAITVYFDATQLTERVDFYSGVLKIVWGHSPTSIDSFLLVPAYLNVPCSDSSYTAASSDDLGGPTFNWVSAKTLGTFVPFESFYSQGASALDDGSSGPWPIGFNFPYYQNYYDSFYIGANGAISFTDSNLNVDGYFSQLDIPGNQFASFLSPFWNDLIIDTVLVPDGGVYIYTSPTLDTTVIEWYRVANFNSTSDTLTDFEIILTADGSILYQYQSVGQTGLETQALVGISEIECDAYGYFDEGDIPENEVGDGTAVLFEHRLLYIQTGDVDNSGGIDIADLLYLVSFMFDVPPGPAPIPYGSGDINCADGVDIGDLLSMVDYMFTFPPGPAPCYNWLYVY